MDKRLAVGIMDLIEDLNIEIIALRTMLMAPPARMTKRQMEANVKRAKGFPDAREVVRSQWKPLRDRLEADSNVDEVFRDLLRAVPATKYVN